MEQSYEKSSLDIRKVLEKTKADVIREKNLKMINDWCKEFCIENKFSCLLFDVFTNYIRSVTTEGIAKERSVNMRTEEIFSKRLKFSMGKMTQRQLAAKIGTTEVTVSRWLNGSRIPKLTDAVQIASVLNVSLDYLSGLSDITNQIDSKLIPLGKALKYCEEARDSWRKFSRDALDNIGKGDSQGSSFGAVAFGEKNEVMYGYEIPNILRLLCEDKENI